MLKTIALEVLLNQALVDDEQIQVAFIYGSYAANRETATSDVDLFVVGSISGQALSAALNPVQAEIQREINYHLVTVEEFQEQLTSGNGFLNNVLESPKVFVIGDEETIRTLAA